MIELDKDYNDQVHPRLTEEEDDFIKEHVHQILHTNSSSQQILHTEESGHETSNSRA